MYCENYTYASFSSDDPRVVGHVNVPDIQAALKWHGRLWGHCKLQVDTITVKAKGCPLKGKQRQDLVISAFEEVFPN